MNGWRRDQKVLLGIVILSPVWWDVVHFFFKWIG